MDQNMMSTVYADDYDGLHQTIYNDDIKTYSDPESAMNAAKETGWDSVVQVGIQSLRDQSECGFCYLVGKIRDDGWDQEKGDCAYTLQTPKRGFGHY